MTMHCGSVNTRGVGGIRMIRTGLCSITFRALAAADVLAAAAAAGLQAVEWGSDVHAPPTSPGLRELAARTADAGLAVCSYGTYFEAGVSDPADFAALSRAAAELGTARLRVWSGTVPTVDASAADRARVVGALRAAADIAADRGQALALEFHAGSLSDSAPAALRLLADVGRPNVSSYWQAPIGLSTADSVAGLRQLLPEVSAVHVFAWTATEERLPLTARADLWTDAFALLRSTGRPYDALLEFVPGDDPAVLPREAAALAALAGAR